MKALRSSMYDGKEIQFSDKHKHTMWPKRLCFELKLESLCT